MATFKIGDPVRIARKHDDTIEDYPYWHPTMDKYIGEVGIITNARDYGMKGWKVSFINGKYWVFDESALEHEKKKEMNSTELYTHLQTECGFEIGDTVKVTAKAKPYQFGWGCPWNGCMDELVGKEIVIGSISPTQGIYDKKDGWWFPFFVLEKVEKPLTYTVKLTKDYDAIVFKDKIVVGCQTITIEKFKELQEALKKHE